MFSLEEAPAQITLLPSTGQRDHRITESFRLEKTLKTIESNHKPNAAKSTTWQQDGYIPRTRICSETKELHSSSYPQDRLAANCKPANRTHRQQEGKLSSSECVWGRKTSTRCWWRSLPRHKSCTGLSQSRFDPTTIMGLTGRIFMHRD